MSPRRTSTVRVRARLGLLAATTVAIMMSIVGVIGTAGDAPTAEAAPLFIAEFDPTPRALGPITVFGDSVLKGSLLYSPTIVDELAARGWGPIRARAGVGDSTSLQRNPSSNATYWIDTWRSSGWNPQDVFINLGANDSGICRTNPTCARNAIMSVVDELGPGHRIWWPKITQFPVNVSFQDTWNAALDQIATELPHFHTWDWPQAIIDYGIPMASDYVHSTPSGYRTRTVLMAEALTSAFTLTQRSGGDAALPTATGAPSELVPIGPVRVIDTRKDPPGRVAANSAIVVDVSAHVPTETTAIAAYVSATNTSTGGFLTAYDCASGRPLASAANHDPGDTRGAVTITPVSPDGTFCLYTLSEADLLVDLQASFVPAGGDGLRFDALPTPTRLIDTRDVGRQQVIELDVPDGAQAVAISLTAVFPEQPGFLTAYPCSDDVPVIATVNYDVGEVVSGTSFLPVGPDGTICVYSLTPTDVTVDLTGTFSIDAPLVFQAAAPTRMVDTRDGTGGWSPSHVTRQAIDAAVAPPEAEAVSGTITMVAPLHQGFTRAWDCGVEPPTANVTAIANVILANAVTTRVSDSGRLCLMANQTSQTLFDTNGWWLSP